MVTLLTVIHIVVCLFLILVVLLQAGKGGGMGIAFGGAGSQTVFGSSGAGNFLTRLTSITATVFLLTSLALAHYASRQDSKRLQQLASEKAAEKKSDDEKAAKLKADMEKMRATSAAGKDGGAAATIPAEGAPGATNAAPSLAPVQLKMPGETSRPGASNTSTPTTVPGNAPGAPAMGEAPARPVVKRRKAPIVPADDAPGTAPATSAPETAPAPAAPAQ
ncbi:MAG: preprotein translocase subunit SecG [Myxococcales bacterium]